jgi:hypothetical protein
MAIWELWLGKIIMTGNCQPAWKFCSPALAATNRLQISGTLRRNMALTSVSFFPVREKLTYLFVEGLDVY